MPQKGPAEAKPTETGLSGTALGINCSVCGGEGGVGGVLQMCVSYPCSVWVQLCSLITG